SSARGAHRGAPAVELTSSMSWTGRSRSSPARYHRAVPSESTIRSVSRVAAAVITLSVVAGCGPPPEGGGLAGQPGAPGSLRPFLVERDWQRWPEYFAPSATINGSDLALQIMRGTADGLNFSFADLELTIGVQVAEPPRVATSFVLEGRHEKPFNDQPATH